MLLAALGSANHDPQALECATLRLYRQHGVDRLVYLGSDGHMDRAVQRLIYRLRDVGSASESLWLRAARRCADGSPATIRGYVEGELERQKLGDTEVLAAPGAVAVELLAGRIVLLTDGLKSLSSDDVLSCAIVVYGSFQEPVVAQRADRWFISPGVVATSGGVLLREDERGVELTILDAQSSPVHTRRLLGASEARLRVSGADDG
jgi:hypothetical protein